MAEDDSNPFVNSPPTESQKFIRASFERAMRRIETKMIDDYLEWLSTGPNHIPAEDSPEDGA